MAWRYVHALRRPVCGFTDKMLAFSQLRGEKGMTYRTGHSIFVDTDEGAHLIEVHVSELRLLNHFGVESTPKLHHQQQHMVVGSTGKKDLSSV